MSYSSIFLTFCGQSILSLCIVNNAIQLIIKVIVFSEDFQTEVPLLTEEIGLPTGTYFYILKYKTATKVKEKTGYLYSNQDN